MEQNMDQVGNMLGNLKNMAVDMGNEIEGQNRQLDRLNTKVSFLGLVGIFFSVKNYMFKL